MAVVLACALLTYGGVGLSVVALAVCQWRPPCFGRRAYGIG